MQNDYYVKYIQSVQAKIYDIGMKLVLWKNCIVDKHKIKPYGVWWWMVGGNAEKYYKVLTKADKVNLALGCVSLCRM